MTSEPSPFVLRQASHLRPGGQVLDLACGNGRHGRWFLEHGFVVTFTDRNLAGVADLAGRAGLIEADLEQLHWPLTGLYDVVVVVNYLYRPRLDQLVRHLEPGGLLVYETFMRGNEAYGRPSNPDYLLEPGELANRFDGLLEQVETWEGFTETPAPAVRQGYCGRLR